ncbi:MAG: competence/damage-inducible protein A [Flavobacteriales bacterium]|nr:competence/damage-inducible protein A [Flavobacteriales bacterium]
MIAEIITIGDEILIGQTIDTNSAWLSQELNKLGVRVSRVTTVADEGEEIKKALTEAHSRVDLVIMTGGLGPTNDDITKITLTEYFQDELVLHDEVLEGINSYFTSKGKAMLPMNRDQALLPSEAKIVRNFKGTASGMWFEKQGKVAISMPGVPYEMKHLMVTGFLDMIAEYFETSSVFHFTVMTFGEGESFIADRIQDWERSLAQEDVKLAYLPSLGTVKMRLSAFGEDKSVLEEKVMRKAAELERLIPELVYGYNEETLSEVVGRLLFQNNRTIATAESCTGGYIAHLLTTVPGCSRYYEGSFCTYSYKSKSEILDVDAQMIIDQGAVSQDVVESMANGVFIHFDTDYSIAVSGIAGPEGGTEDKPVGTVWMSVGTKDKLVTKCYHFGRNRKNNIRMTAYTALNELRKQLLEL